MSLNDEQLKERLRDLFTNARNGTGDAETNLTAFIDDFVSALNEYVKTAQVVYTTGLEAGPYPVTGTFEGGLE